MKTSNTRKTGMEGRRGTGERQGWEAGEIGMNDISVRDESEEKQGWRTGEEGMEDRRGRDGRQEDRGS